MWSMDSMLIGTQASTRYIVQLHSLTMGSVNNNSISGGSNWKHIPDHQMWVQVVLKTIENLRNLYSYLTNGINIEAKHVWHTQMPTGPLWNTYLHNTPLLKAPIASTPGQVLSICIQFVVPELLVLFNDTIQTYFIFWGWNINGDFAILH